MMITTERLQLQHIPALLWGPPTGRLIIAVHGLTSSKEDVIFKILAEAAIPQGWQVLSFDMAEHGERKGLDECLDVWSAATDLAVIWDYAMKQASQFRLFGCSQGAFYSLLNYADKPIEHAYFLSPVVNMLLVMQGMMRDAHVTEADLERRKIINDSFTPMHWDYYCYVKAHPIEQWPIPTDILHGSQDTMCAQYTMDDFCQRFGASLTVVDSEHYFHTPGQLRRYLKWIKKTISK